MAHASEAGTRPIKWGRRGANALSDTCDTSATKPVK